MRLVPKLGRIAAGAGLCGAFAAGVLALAVDSAGAATDPAAQGLSFTPFTPPSGAHFVAPSFIDTTRIIGSPQNARVPTWDPQVAAAPGFGSHGTAPTITVEPSSETVSAGQTASFTAAASGTPTPTVQWYESTNGGRAWSQVRGATSDTYSFAATSSENGYEYEAIFRNFAGSATTTPTTLTVTTTLAPPTITTEPASETVTNGSTATFSAAASGNPTPTVQWYESTNSGGSFSAISGATSDSYSFTTSANETGDEFYAVFQNSQGSAQTNTVTLSVTAAAVQSSNWSGYADQGANGTFSAVSGSWTVPTVACSGRGSSYSAEWVGIDGYSSNTVEQTGSEADCINGSPSYDAWYEMYGDSAVDNGYEVELSPTTNPVSPGDEMSAAVSESGGVWTITISDTTQGWTSPITVDFTTAEQSSAEWIVERPELCSAFSCSLTSLANFSSVTFTGTDATSARGAAPISSYTYSDIEMVNGSTPLAEPGALNSSGNGFTDTWEAS